MGSGPRKQEAMMITEQERYTCVQSTARIANSVSPTAAEPVQLQFNSPDVTHNRLFEFAGNAPATLAERYPHLTVFAVSAAVLLTAVAAEIDCLRGSGYFWR